MTDPHRPVPRSPSMDAYRDDLDLATTLRPGAVNRRPPSTKAIVALAWVAAGVTVAGATALGVGPLAGIAGIATGSTNDTISFVAEPFTSVDVTSTNVDVSVRYGDISEPQIVESNLREGSLAWRVEDGKLVVEHRETGGGWQWFTSERISVVLPHAMAASTPDVEVSTSMASIDVDGAFGDVRLTASTGSVEGEGSFERFTGRTSTGSLDVRGPAGSIDVEATTGSIDVRTTDAETVRAVTTTGSVDVEIAGAQPKEVTTTTATGSIDVEVPEGRYAVDARAGTGSADIEVDTDDASPHRITARTNTGSVDITD